MEKVLIITGGSKGIGNAILKRFLAEDFIIYSISRSIDTSVKSDVVHQIQLDLLDKVKLFSKFKEVVDSNINPKEFVLINNAGTLGQVNSIGKIDSSDIIETLELNTTIPMLLCNQFIQSTQGLNIKKTIINISSGAAINPIEGWSVYCSSKAAIDMMVKVVGEEQESADFPIKILSIYPGKVDTEMQSKIRAFSQEQFPLVHQFIDYKKKGDLKSPLEVADKIYQILCDENVKNGAIIRL